MKKKLFIISIEPLPSRYTSEWHKYLPTYLEKNLPDFDVEQVDGMTNSGKPTDGAFLDFAGTNRWKNEQMDYLLWLIQAGKMPKGSHVLFTDAWNPTVTELKYTSELLGLDLVLHGLFHAGSYDPQDFLGRLIGAKPWVRNLEKSMFACYDHNYFATDSHVKMFFDTILNDGYPDENPWYDEDYEERYDDGKIVKTGWPMGYMAAELAPAVAENKKRDLILFPHRIAPEKQVEIFRDLAKELPQYDWVVCQDKELTKDEYHSLLAQSKMVFSANLQETYGISICVEAPMARALPLAPNRLSYTEILGKYPEFLYPSEWTTSWEAYLQNKQSIIDRIKHMMINYNALLPVLDRFVAVTYPEITTFKLRL